MTVKCLNKTLLPMVDHPVRKQISNRVKSTPGSRFHPIRPPLPAALPQVFSRISNPLAALWYSCPAPAGGNPCKSA